MAKSPVLQDLSPASARLCLEVERFCREHLSLPQGARLVLGLSGGADSTALAVILHVLAPRLGLGLSALTVNHGLRPEAGEDAAHARRLCRALHMDCELREADVTGLARARGLGLEDAGRRLRYALLEEERQRRRADFIVLGHHLGDVSEDVLMRLTRGAGWPALGGMPARDDERRLLRPLLLTPPEALRELLRRRNLDWREDASNTDIRFKRNRLRHNVLPLLREENPSLDKNLADLWQLARHDADYWDKTLNAALAACPWLEEGGPAAHPGEASAVPHALTLPRGLLRGLHPAARLRLYVRAVRRLCAGGESSSGHASPQGQPRARTLLALDAALRHGRGNTLFQLPGGVEALLKNGSVRLRKK